MYIHKKWTYYNDVDPKVCAWAEELIRLRLVPPGEVDCRSILDVDPNDLKRFSQWHFFCGILGWPYALRLAGMESVPGIMTGSPPCQPFSSAGQQKGKDDERHLAPKFIELVRAVRPRVLFGEQVASAAVFGKTAGSARNRAGKEPEWAWIDDLSDRLEAAHYAVGASDIPAAGVGAPHIRQRTFFCAIAIKGLDDSIQSGLERHAGNGDRGGEPGRVEAGSDRPVAPESGFGGMADADSRERGRQSEYGEHEFDWEEIGWEQRNSESSGGQSSVRMANTPSSGRREEREVHRRIRSGDRPKRGSAGCEPSSVDSGMADASSGSSGDEREQCSREYGLQSQNGSDVRPGNSGSWAGSVEHERTSADHEPWGNVDWLFCRDGKWRPTLSTHEQMVDGLPTRVVQGRNLFHPLTEGEEARVPRLKGYGNAIVPQAAAVFIESVMESIWWIK